MKKLAHLNILKAERSPDKKTAKIKGFRAGKIPVAVLEKYYGAQMEQEVLSRLINDTYFQALQENAIPVVGEPNILDSSGIIKGEAFTYEAEVEIKPEITAKDYTKLSLEKAPVSMV
mgnify:CR=1 FL=1